MAGTAALQREIRQLAQAVKRLFEAGIRTDVNQGLAIAAVIARSQRFGVLIDPLATGFTVLPIEWPEPFPNAVYLVIPTVVVTSAQQGQVTIQAGGKTAAGCTLSIRNTSGVTPACIVDVLAIR